MAKTTRVQDKAALTNQLSGQSVLRIENVLLVVIAAVLLVGGSLLWRFSTDISQITDELQSQVTNITAIVQRVSSDVDGLHASVGDIASGIDQMSTEISYVSAEVQRMASDVSQSSAEVQRVATEVSHTSAEVGRLSAEMSFLAAGVAQVQNRLDTLETALIYDEASPLVVPTSAPMARTSLSSENTVDSGSTKAILYRVRPGDTLWHISASLLGSPNRHPVISELNNLDPPSLIRPGDQLLIPIGPEDQYDVDITNMK